MPNNILLFPPALFGGGGGGVGGASPNRHLFVNGYGWSLGADPSKYFTTISGALAEALTLVPVPSQDNPVQITVYPAHYPEDPAISSAGISLVGEPDMRSFITPRIVGTLTVNLGAGIDRDLNHCTVQGFQIDRLRFTGVNPQKLYLTNIVCENSADDTFVMDNTGLDAGLDDLPHLNLGVAAGPRRSQVIAQHLTLRCEGPVFRSLKKSAGDLEIFHGFIRQTPDTDIAIDYSGVGDAGSGFSTLVHVEINGLISMAGNAPLTLFEDLVSSTAPATSLIAQGSTSNLVVVETVLTSLFSPLVSGVGPFFFDQNIEGAAGNGYAGTLNGGLGPLAILVEGVRNQRFRVAPPSAPGDWVGAPPTDAQTALNRIAAWVAAGLGPIP